MLMSATRATLESTVNFWFRWAGAAPGKFVSQMSWINQAIAMRNTTRLARKASRNFSIRFVGHWRG